MITLFRPLTDYVKNENFELTSRTFSFRFIFEKHQKLFTLNCRNKRLKEYCSLISSLCWVDDKFIILQPIFWVFIGATSAILGIIDVYGG